VNANLSSYDTISIGNGQREAVNANGSSYDEITLGNGSGDMVNANFTNNASSHDIITLGNGAGDSVDADGSIFFGFLPSATPLRSAMVPVMRWPFPSMTKIQSPSATALVIRIPVVSKASLTQSTLSAAAQPSRAQPVHNFLRPTPE
jgi:hypothetical protein